MRKIIVHIVSFLLVILFATACVADNECRQDLNVQLKMGVYTIKNGTATSLTVDSVWAKGLLRDSVLFNNVKSKSSLKFPLNAASTESSFVVRFNEITDTIAFLYTTNPTYFISTDCGCIAQFKIEEVFSTGHFIDSIQIIQPEVINYDAEHIKIFHN